MCEVLEISTSTYYKYRDILKHFGDDTTDDDMISLDYKCGNEEYYKTALNTIDKKIEIKNERKRRFALPKNIIPKEINHSKQRKQKKSGQTNKQLKKRKPSNLFLLRHSP